MKRRSALHLSLLSASTLASGCTFLRGNSVPMFNLQDRLPDTVADKSLLVMLPGVQDYPNDFLRYGFVDTVRKRRLALDIVAVDANLRYFENRSIDVRIENDIVAPARARGYRNIWLVGISLGALGAILHAARRSPVSGIVAIAPFLGRPEGLAEVETTGGFARWEASPTSDMRDWEVSLYTWLKRFAHNAKPDQPELLLAYGRSDRFVREQMQLAALLGPQRSITTAGAHDWPTWRTLWDDVLDEWGDRFVAATA